MTADLPADANFFGSPMDLALAISELPGGAVFTDQLLRIPQTNWPTLIARRSGFKPPATWTGEQLGLLYQHVATLLKEKDNASTPEG